jgi:hypothetical protein
MRDLERQQWRKWKVTKGTRADILFVREATHGGSRTRLSPFAIEIIEKAWGATMQELGYELACRRE